MARDCEGSKVVGASERPADRRDFVGRGRQTLFGRRRSSVNRRGLKVRRQQEIGGSELRAAK